jgi:hypothetical protein
VHLDAVTRKSCLLPEDARRGAQAALVSDSDRWSDWSLPASLLE